MKIRRLAWCVLIQVLLLSLSGQAQTAAKDRVRILDVRGSALVQGEHAVLKVDVEYSLQSADGGIVVLVLQRPDTSELVSKHPQASIEVTRGKRRATLEDEFDIPNDASEMVLFVAVVPSGHKKSSDDAWKRYRIASPKKKRQGQSALSHPSLRLPFATLSQSQLDQI